MKLPRRKYLLYGSTVIIGLALILEGYGATWTGFGDYQPPSNVYIRGKTLWDWMELFIIPLFLAGAAFYLNRSEREADRQRIEEQSKLQNERTEKQAILERQIATDRQQEAALQSFLDRMADLLLQENLRVSENEELRNVARIRTLTVLRGLDEKRKGMVLLFLQESGLISSVPIINLKGANLLGTDVLGDVIRVADLRGAHLIETNLVKAKLNWADLSGADLTRADLTGAALEFATLDQANLCAAILPGAHLNNAKLNGADLRGINLENAQLLSAELKNANLYTAYLRQANLSYANLTGADLRQAILAGTDFTKATLEGANLSDADFTGANLSGANLYRANISDQQFATVKSLQGTLMPDGTRHD